VVSAPAGTITFGTSNITFSEFSSSQTYTANTNAGLSLTGTVFSAKVDNDTTAFDGAGNIMVKAGANLTTPNIGAATGTSISLTGNVTGGNVLTGGVVSATANITGGNVLTAGVISATANITGGNLITAGTVSATGNVSGNYFLGNGSALTGVIAAGGQGNTITLGTPTDGNLVQNVAYPGWTTATFVTDGLDDLNQVAFNIANSTYVGNAYITANVSSGPSPLSVALTGRYIGNPNAYLWQFGDGTANVTTANATHTFSNVSGGTFTVTYTAFNTNGTHNGGNAANGAKGSTSTATTTITLYTPTPIPSFSANRTSLDTPGGVLITNTSQYAETYSINWEMVL
jgi:PKD repeat protein